MRVALKTLCDKLAVGRVLYPYETQPWAHYDEAKGLTCSAEVRAAPNLEDVEAEIQLVRDEGATDYDTPLPIRRKRRSEYDEDDEEEGGDGSEGAPPSAPPPPPGVPDQVFLLRAEPMEGEWEIKSLMVKGKNYTNEFSDWDEKGCNFFRACIQAMLRGEIPDFDSLIEEELSDDDFFGSGKRGRAGRKAPKANPASLMGMKKGM